MRLAPKSVRVRLNLWILLAFFAVLVVYAGVIFLSVRQYLFADLDRNLRTDIEAAQEVLEEIAHRPAALAALQRQDRWILEVWDRKTGALAAELPGIAMGLGRPAEDCGRDLVVYSNFTMSDGLRVRVACRRYRSGDGEYVVRSARPAERTYDEIRRLLMIMIFGLPIGLAAAAVAGFALTGKALAPVASMTQQARAITAERLHDRLEVRNSADELGQLAIAFNETFERLQKAFENMRQFTADASHELRTPLTAIRTLGEVALRSSADGQVRAEVLSNILEEADRLRHLIESLLTLSRADAGRIRLEPARGDLGILATEVVQHLAVLAEEKNQKLTVETAGAPAVFDAGILRQAVINLVDNAIKYSPEGTAIKVRSYANGAASVLEVIDQGPGIAPEHRERIFERFYRIDQSRSREGGGAGLGLAIAAWAVKANGGTLALASESSEGCSFRILLPHA